MNIEKSFSSNNSLPDTHLQLWILSLLFFGLGDILTTGFGLTAGGVIELNPLAAILIQKHSLAVILVLKAGFLSGSYVLWKVLPEPHSLGIPLGLATLGVSVTLWNVLILCANIAL